MVVFSVFFYCFWVVVLVVEYVVFFDRDFFDGYLCVDCVFFVGGVCCSERFFLVDLCFGDVGLCFDSVKYVWFLVC